MQLNRFILVPVILFLFSAIVAVAQDQPSFKRVSVPKPGTAPKIDVQIDPDSYFDYFNPPAPDPSAPPVTNVVSVPDRSPELPYGDFWSQVTAASSTGILTMDKVEEAMQVTGLPGPRLMEVQRLANRFGREIMLNTIDTRVSPALVLAVILTESGGRPDAVSHAGAQGLMQLIPATADRFGVKDAMSPDQNIRGGVAYLDWLMDEFGGNPVHVLAAYNAGENNVKEHGGAPPFSETRAYVPKVLAAWAVSRGLCLTPPDLISDPCVLKLGEIASEG